MKHKLNGTAQENKKTDLVRSRLRQVLEWLEKVMPCLPGTTVAGYDVRLNNEFGYAGK